LALDVVLFGKLVKSFIQGEKIVAQGRRRRFDQIEILPLPIPAPSQSLAAAGVLYQNAAHGLGGRGKEVVAAVPVVCFLHLVVEEGLDEAISPKPNHGFLSEKSTAKRRLI